MSNEKQIPELLTAKEASKILNNKVSASMFYKLAQNKQIPHVRFGAKIFFDVESINGYINGELEKNYKPASNKFKGLQVI